MLTYGLPIYIRIAKVLKSLGDEVDLEDETVEQPCEILEAIRAATDRNHQLSRNQRKTS